MQGTHKDGRMQLEKNVGTFPCIDEGRHQAICQIS